MIKTFIALTANWQLVSTDDDDGDDLFTANIPYILESIMRLCNLKWYLSEGSQQAHWGPCREERRAKGGRLVVPPEPLVFPLGPWLTWLTSPAPPASLAASWPGRAFNLWSTNHVLPSQFFPTFFTPCSGQGHSKYWQHYVGPSKHGRLPSGQCCQGHIWNCVTLLTCRVALRKSEKQRKEKGRRKVCLGWVPSGVTGAGKWSRVRPMVHWAPYLRTIYRCTRVTKLCIETDEGGS